MKKRIVSGLFIIFAVAVLFFGQPLMNPAGAAATELSDAQLPVYMQGAAEMPVAPPLSIGNYVQVGNKRITLTEYQYTYSAVITNTGQAVNNVTAVLTSVDPNTIVIEDMVQFGNVEAASTKTGINTFTIQQNRLYSFNPANMIWEISFDAAPNPPPTANAGPDQLINAGDTVTLDGRSSVGFNDMPINYRWSFVEKPDGSTAELNNSTVVRPTFVVDLPGTYVVELICSDISGDSVPDQVILSAEAVPPTANAGPDQSVTVGTTVQLNGSGSTDLNGLQLTYKWSFVDRPTESTAGLDDETAVTPTFMVDLPGSYKLQLVVSNSYADSTPDMVEISTEALQPVANAGVDQNVEIMTTVMLDGSGSYGLNGLQLAYEWSFVSLPEGSVTTLQNADTMTPTFMVDVPGDYIVQLIVNDTLASSTADTVLISTSVVPPTANAGDDQTVPTNTEVELNGTGSTDPQNYPLTYVWTIVSQPEGSDITLSGGDNATPTFTPVIAGMYVVQLVVNNGVLSSEPVTMTVEATTPMVEVPNVVEMTYAEAMASIEAAGLTPHYAGSDYHETIPQGSIILQSIAAGTMVEIGSTVSITASAGPSLVVVPELVGLTQAEAEAALTAVGLVPNHAGTESHATIPEGSVTRQSADAGSSVQVGTQVDFWVSSGNSVTVPDLMGMPQAEAEALLTELGLRPWSDGTQAHETIPAGSVMWQREVAGTSVQVNSWIYYRISSGNAVVVPDLIGMPEAEAQALLTSLGLQYSNRGTRSHETAPVGSVAWQHTSTNTGYPSTSGQEVQVNSTIYYQLSSGNSVVVPDLIGMPEAEAQALLTSLGLRFSSYGTRSHATIPAGSVVWQQISANTSLNSESGQAVQINSIVYFFVSSGPAVVVPDLIGMPRAEAEALLTSLGLSYYHYGARSHETIPVGSVISQDHDAGTFVAPGSQVRFYTSSGPMVEVPDLIGMPRAEAEALLTSLGLSYYHYGTRSHATIPAGSVISQDHDAGTFVAPGGQVRYWTSSGPAEP